MSSPIPTTPSTQAPRDESPPPSPEVFRLDPSITPSAYELYFEPRISNGIVSAGSGESLNTLGARVGSAHDLDDYEGSASHSIATPSLGVSAAPNLPVDHEAYYRHSRVFGIAKITLSSSRGHLKQLTLHAYELEVKHIEWYAAEQGRSAAVDAEGFTLDEENELLRIDLGQTIPANRDIVVVVEYLAMIDDIFSAECNFHTRGLFFSDPKVDPWSLATQLEPTNARRLFPCFDEPKFKAVFTLSVRYPHGYVCIGPTPVASERLDVSMATIASANNGRSPSQDNNEECTAMTLSGEDLSPNSHNSQQQKNDKSTTTPLQKSLEGPQKSSQELGSDSGNNSPQSRRSPQASFTKQTPFRVVTFEPTPLISPYIVAFAIGKMHSAGELQTSRGIVCRVWLPTSVPSTNGFFTLELLKKAIDFFEQYFQFNLDVKKVDIVALEEFEMLGMENWGLLTFAKNFCAVSENTPIARRQRIARLVGHEVVHQWFGNLVSLEWWNAIWLKEGMARFMEFVFVHEHFRGWQIWSDFVLDIENDILIRDGLAMHPHPIEVDAPLHPRKVFDYFDFITYGKAACLIRTISNIVSENVLTLALRSFIQRFAYDTATSNDLIQCIKEQAAKAHAAAPPGSGMQQLPASLFAGSSVAAAREGAGAAQQQHSPPSPSLDAVISGWVHAIQHPVLYVCRPQEHGDDQEAETLSPLRSRKTEDGLSRLIDTQTPSSDDATTFPAQPIAQRGAAQHAERDPSLFEIHQLACPNYRRAFISYLDTSLTPRGFSSSGAGGSAVGTGGGSAHRSSSSAQQQRPASVNIRTRTLFKPARYPLPVKVHEVGDTGKTHHVEVVVTSAPSVEYKLVTPPLLHAAAGPDDDDSGSLEDTTSGDGHQKDFGEKRTSPSRHRSEDATSEGGDGSESGKDTKVPSRPGSAGKQRAKSPSTVRGGGGSDATTAAAAAASEGGGGANATASADGVPPAEAATVTISKAKPEPKPAEPILCWVNASHTTFCRTLYSTDLWLQHLQRVMMEAPLERITAVMNVFEMREFLIGVEHPSDAVDRCVIPLRLLYEMYRKGECHAAIVTYTINFIERLYFLVFDCPCWTEVRELLKLTVRALVVNRLNFSFLAPPKENVVDFRMDRDLPMSTIAKAVRALSVCGDRDITAAARDYVSWMGALWCESSAASTGDSLQQQTNAPSSTRKQDAAAAVALATSVDAPEPGAPSGLTAPPAEPSPLLPPQPGDIMLGGLTADQNANGAHQQQPPQPTRFVIKSLLPDARAADLSVLDLDIVGVGCLAAARHFDSVLDWWGIFHIWAHCAGWHSWTKPTAEGWQSVPDQLDIRANLVVPNKEGWAQALLPAVLVCPLASVQSLQLDILEDFPLDRTASMNTTMAVFRNHALIEAYLLKTSSRAVMSHCANFALTYCSSYKIPDMFEGAPRVGVAVSRDRLQRNGKWADYVSDHYSWYITTHLLPQVRGAGAHMRSRSLGGTLGATHAGSHNDQSSPHDGAVSV